MGSKSHLYTARVPIESLKHWSLLAGLLMREFNFARAEEEFTHLRIAVLYYVIGDRVL